VRFRGRTSQLRTTFISACIVCVGGVIACEPIASPPTSPTRPNEPARVEDAMGGPWQALPAGLLVTDRLDSLCLGHMDAAGISFPPNQIMRDVRGGGLALYVSVAKSKWAYCVVELDGDLLDVREVGEVASPPVMTDGEAVGGINQARSDGPLMRFAFGVADRSLDGVDLILRDGTIVRASLFEGWWAAWWPTDLEAIRAMPG
jgi:hypothetical protein